MKAVALLLFTVAALAAKDRVGIIDFFGYKGYDVTALRAAIPVKPGDPLQVTADNLDALTKTKQDISAAVERFTDHDATDIAMVCCDRQGDWEIYIGIAGKSSRQIRWNREPSGSLRLPDQAMALYGQYEAEVLRAVQEGTAAEDDSAGYSLSKDPKLRAIELSICDYTLHHYELLRQAVATSGDSHHRAVAATFLGYADQSPDQIAALVTASHDPSDDVRNNATRAIGSMAIAHKGTFPTRGFVDMLSSGTWKDRNKAMMVLDPLTQTGNPQLRAQIRARALDALQEMAQWQCPDHSAWARDILQRVTH